MIRATRIHSQYVEGTCHRQSSCRFGHNLNTQHNRRVLDRHRAGGICDEEILQLLWDNLAARSGRWVLVKSGSSSIDVVSWLYLCAIRPEPHLANGLTGPKEPASGLPYLNSFNTLLLLTRHFHFLPAHQFYVYSEKYYIIMVRELSGLPTLRSPLAIFGRKNVHKEKEENAEFEA